MFCNRLSEKEGRSPCYKLSRIKYFDGGKNIESADVEWLRETDGYRLPTEAEWEYACRAGSISAFNAGEMITPDQANFNAQLSSATSAIGVFRGKTVEVQSFSPNAYGLHNMHGNVSEWCWDYYTVLPAEAIEDPAVSIASPSEGVARVTRGGDWECAPPYCRSAFRMFSPPSDLNAGTGFRIVVGAGR